MDCFFRHDEDCYLYGVFDGHDGSRAANFAAQRMPAELLLGQLLEKTTDEDIKDVLNQVRRHIISLFIIFSGIITGIYMLSNIRIHAGLLFMKYL